MITKVIAKIISWAITIDIVFGSLAVSAIFLEMFLERVFNIIAMF